MSSRSDHARTDVLRLAPDLTQRQVGEQLFAVSPEGRMVVLDNATAIALWNALVEAGSGGITEAQLAGVLVAIYEVDDERAGADVTAFVDALERGGVLRRGAGGPTFP